VNVRKSPSVRFALSVALLWIGAPASSAQTGIVPDISYYVAGNGDDSHTGLSPSDAWRTIDRVNQQVLAPGVCVMFEGGAVFSGTLTLDPSEDGRPGRPVTFASYGTGQAILSAGAGTGFDLIDVSYVRITDLIVAGAGGTLNSGIGISFYTDLPGNVKLPWVRIDNCRVTGFRHGGISIGSYNGRTGFEDVRVTSCRLDHNGNNGMAVWGFYDPSWGQTAADYPHRSIYVGHNVFESNWGDPLLTNKHTGSGVEIAQASDVLVEFNEAFDNGRLNTYSGGGPVGIWMWDVLQGVIQNNESHHNGSASIDGGGFDLDGGTVQCVMQYNYSHDNDGPGFMVAQFSNGARPMSDVTVRYNVSERDGGRGNSGALQLWTGDPSGPPVDTAMFYGNTVFVEAKPFGTAKAFRVFGSGTIATSGFSNNIFYTRGPNVWLGECALQQPPLWTGNLYFAELGLFTIRDTGASYSSLLAWRLGRGQERLSGSPTGVQTNPLLNAAGGGGTLGDPTLLSTLDAYRLQSGSPVSNYGLPLPLFGIAVGSHDFYGQSVPGGAGYSIGACDAP